jgi:hypothetical protein
MSVFNCEMDMCNLLISSINSFSSLLNILLPPSYKFV